MMQVTFLSIVFVILFAIKSIISAESSTKINKKPVAISNLENGLLTTTIPDSDSRFANEIQTENPQLNQMNNVAPLGVIDDSSLKTQKANEKVDDKIKPSVDESSLNRTKEPLILTHYLNNGKLTEARELARVTALHPNVTSYSGYFKVDSVTCDSNMFFWFFPAESSYETAPLTIWLQGGPGMPSIFGLFNENGPFALKNEDEIYLRNGTWTKVSSMLYIDNPVGTGFSYTNSEHCLSRNQSHIAANLLETVQQFLLLFPELKKTPLFITGQSYAGKYNTALAYAIHKHNQNSTNLINLAGIAIGNGFVDPVNQMVSYGDFLYYLGFIDEAAREIFRREEDLCHQYIKEEKWTLAVDLFHKHLNSDSFLANVTRFQSLYNFLAQPEADDVSKWYFSEFVDKAHVRLAMHVGNQTLQVGNVVSAALQEDLPKSVAPWLEEVLEHYRVLIYTGQMDIIINYHGVRTYINQLRWSRSADYRKARRRPWYVGSDLAGYIKQAGKLTNLMIRNSGHAVPVDQPVWAFDMFSKFLNDSCYPEYPY